MSAVGGIENGTPLLDGFQHLAMMHRNSRREKAQSGMAVLVVAAR